MADLNLVTMIGRIAGDIDLRYSAEGTAVVSFSLAVNRGKEKEVDFIRCKAFKKTAEILAEFCKKGSRINVVGNIRTGSYEKDGKKVYVTDIIVDRFQFLDAKPVEQKEEPNGNTLEDDIPF